jgi:hypothetical protein
VGGGNGPSLQSGGRYRLVEDGEVTDCGEAENLNRVVSVPVSCCVCTGHARNRHNPVASSQPGCWNR